MPDPNAPKGMQYRIAPDVIRVAAARVYGSQTFKAAKQQEILLRFLVDDYLAGRAQNGSREAVIAEFFADRPEEEVGRKLAWAFTRLSEKLAEYYLRDGADDPIRMFVEPTRGGLRFEMWESEVAARSDPNRKVPLRILTALVALVAAVGIGVVMMLTPTEMAEGPQEDWPRHISDLVTEDVALPEGVETMSKEALVDLARSYQFPMLNTERLKVAIVLSKAAIDKDPAYALGYATGAFSLATMASVTRGGALSRRYLQEASILRDQSLALAPDDGWVLVSAAFVAQVANEYVTAEELSKAAVTAAPDDGYVAHVYAVISLYLANYDEVLLANAPSKIPATDPIRFIRERLYAFGSFHLEDFDTTIRVLEEAASEGVEHNVATMLYLTAAYQATADHEKARALVGQIQANWPSLRPGVVANMFFRDPSEGRMLKHHLSEAGLPFPE